LLRQWIENLGTTFSSQPGEKAGGNQRAESSFYPIDMLKYAEKKISLVGWGEWQVMLHTLNGHTGLTVVEDNRITKFGLTPWLKGLIAVVPTKARYCHGHAPLGECADIVMEMRRNAFEDAMTAIDNQDVLLLAEAVITTYLAQQQMGAELLPNCGEIAKRFSGRYGVYVFSQPIAITDDIKSNAVMAA
jgi:hypothetical protein